VEFSFSGTIYPYTSDDYIMIYFKKDTIECGTPDTTDSASVSSIYELEKYPEGISLFPNPASDFFLIHTRQFERYEIFIYNATGILVRRINLVTSDQPIDISLLTKGFYFAIIESDKKTYQEKFIKE
jgi:hypothetical protein